MGSHPSTHLLAELMQALHDESDALIANDAARLVEAGNRREHLLRLLAPQACALRSMRRCGSDEFERLAQEAARLAAVDGGHAVMSLGRSSTALAGRLALLRATGAD